MEIYDIIVQGVAPTYWAVWRVAQQTLQAQLAVDNDSIYSLIDWIVRLYISRWFIITR